MRVPTIETRRRPPNRRLWLAGLAAVAVVLLVSLRGIAGFYTDYLWFKEVGYTEVWRGLLFAKAVPAVVFTAAFFLLILGNLIIADRLAPKFRPAGPEEEIVERYRQIIGPYAGRVRVAVAAFLALIAASGLTSQWLQWVLFRNRVPFGGPGDPQFGTDIGFYLFTLPFLRFLFEWTFAALVIVLLVTAVALWSFVSVVIGGIYPAFIQKFQVEPNEFQKEQPYIKRNITATRTAFGLDKVSERPFDYGENLTAADIESNQGTIGDARLWDPKVLGLTYKELQQFRPQYVFNDADTDRYKLDGEMRQVVLSGRELNLDKLPSQTWQNRHLVYTHGYGIVGSPSNVVTPDGRPTFVVKDIPPQSTEPGQFEISQPALYYGQTLSRYAFVHTKHRAFHDPNQPQDATTTYQGKGGVR